MQLRELLNKTDIVEASADLDARIAGVCFDTRKTMPGELFVAIRGFERDGHRFIGEAAEKGASCVICEEAPDVEIPYIVVKNSRIALAEVSAAWFGYPAEKLKIIGVTGTNGKTTVTNLLKQVIEKCTGEKAGLIGTIGNMIGDVSYPSERTTPESYDIHGFLDRIVREGGAYAIMEVSSHALELGRVHGIVFDAAVFTNLTPEHLDFHDSLDDYARAKSLLFSSCRGAAINIDDRYAPVMAANVPDCLFTYAVDDDAADLVAKNVKLHSDSIDFSILMIGKLIRINLPIPGMFSVYNALAVISASLLLGLDIDCITRVLETCTGVKGRAEVAPSGGDFTVLIDYAHTPDALSNIISAARGFARGRVVTLFGCGGDRDRIKRPLMGEIASGLSDFVIVTSDNPRTEEPAAIIEDILAGMTKTATPYRVIENRREAIFWALDNSGQGDVLILAGKGHETYQIIGREKTDFDERKVVADFFEQGGA